MNHGLPASARRRADLMLLGVTLCWGISFPVIKLATPFAPPAAFVALRFTMAALLMLAAWPLLARDLPAPARARPWRALAGRAAWRWGSGLGLLVAVSYTSQTLGLHTTSANNSAFITSLNVLLVPLLLFAMRRQRPEREVAIAVALAACGLALMTRPDLGRLAAGDLWTLLCAVTYALYLIQLSSALRHVPYQVLLVITVVVCAALTGAWALLIERTPPIWAKELVVSLVVTTLFSTILALWLQNRYQRFTTPTRAALIFSAEPVFASLLAWMLLGERLAGLGWLGAAMILGAVLAAEVGGVRGKPPEDARGGS